MSAPAAYDLIQGSSPVLISMPHSGTQLTPEVAQGLTTTAKLLPDTDWHIPQLYSMAKSLEVTCLQARYSRYVVDLNRALDDKPLYATKTTGLFPQILFADEPVFEDGKAPDEAHQDRCKRTIWQPYHDAIYAQLQRLKQLHGYAILLDAHSIASQVPMLFEGRLPDFNWGNNDGVSCPASMLTMAQESVYGSAYTQVSNGRFKGGYITRHYGQPSERVFALQLELGQDTYLQDGYQHSQSYQCDAAKLKDVQAVIQRLVQGLCQWRPA